MAEDEAKFVKLVSAEGHDFIMERSIAIAYSKTIRLMLEGSFREAQEGVIRFPDLSGYILERVVKYLHYKAQYSNATSRIPEFVSSVIAGTTLKNQSSHLFKPLYSAQRIEPEVALELLLAAKYLDC